MALVVKNLPGNAGDVKRQGFNPWVRKIPWGRAWQPTPVFLPGESSWIEEPGRLQSMGSQRVGHGWSDLVQHQVRPQQGSALSLVHCKAEFLSFYWVWRTLSFFPFYLKKNCFHSSQSNPSLHSLWKLLDTPPPPFPRLIDLPPPYSFSPRIQDHTIWCSIVLQLLHEYCFSFPGWVVPDHLDNVSFHRGIKDLLAGWSKVPVGLLP